MNAVAPRRIRLLIATIVLGLIAPMLVNAAPAEARRAAPVKNRTAIEHSIQNSVLKLINKQRKAHHLKPLKMDKKLKKAARRHNAEMARANRMSHKLPGESALGRRIDRAGYNWGAIAENVGWNSAMNRGGVLELQKLMYNEKAPADGHRRNILSRSYRNVGVDVYYDAKNDKVWLTTDFGRKM